MRKTTPRKSGSNVYENMFCENYKELNHHKTFQSIVQFFFIFYGVHCTGNQVTAAMFLVVKYNYNIDQHYNINFLMSILIFCFRIEKS